MVVRKHKSGPITAWVGSAATCPLLGDAKQVASKNPQGVMGELDSSLRPCKLSQSGVPVNAGNVEQGKLSRLRPDDLELDKLSGLDLPHLRSKSLFVLLLWAFSFVAEAKLSARAILPETLVGLGQEFELSLEVRAPEKQNITWPNMAALKPDFSEERRFHSSRFQSSWSFGKANKEYIYVLRLILKAHKLGWHDLPEFEISAAGVKLKTQKLALEVVEPKKAPPRVRTLPNWPGGGLGSGHLLDSFKDFFNDTDPFDRVQNAKSFVRLKVDKTKAYIGEPIMAEWFFYTQHPSVDLEPVNPPDLGGFWKEEIIRSDTLHFEQEVVGGEMYKKSLLSSYVVFPLSHGELDIGAYEVRLRAFGNSKAELKKSTPLKIEALPLPPKAPKSFTQGVGEFNVKLLFDKATMRQREPWTLRLSISSVSPYANARRVALPASLKWPEGLELYDTKVHTEYKASGKSLKIFEFVFLPQNLGTVVMPPLTLGFFNPQTQQYYEKLTTQLSLNVQPGLQTPNSTASDAATDNVQDLARGSGGLGSATAPRSLALLKSLGPVGWYDAYPLWVWRLFVILALVIAVGVWSLKRQLRFLKVQGLDKKVLLKIKHLKRLQQKLQKVTNASDGANSGFNEEQRRLLAREILDVLNFLAWTAVSQLQAQQNTLQHETRDISYVVSLWPADLRSSLGGVFLELSHVFSGYAFAPQAAPDAGAVTKAAFSKQLELLIHAALKLEEWHKQRSRVKL